jgi:hypothetical protein
LSSAYCHFVNPFSFHKKKTQQLPTTQTTGVSPAPTLTASTSHPQIEEILLLLRLTGVVGMIDLEMQIEEWRLES